MRPLQSQPATPFTGRLRVRFLGNGVPYAQGMAVMTKAMSQIDAPFDEEGGPVLLLLEHKDTITTTRLHGQRSVLVDPVEVRQAGIDLIETDRGGDVTFHGFGQLVGYLVMRLRCLPESNPQSVDLQGYVRSLEMALLQATRSLGLKEAHTLEGKTGVWCSDPTSDMPKKITAIGVGVSKGVTRHGFAMNISTNLERFLQYIVPCGLKGYGVTSLEREIDVPPIKTICEVIVNEICEVFNLSPFYEPGFDARLSRLNLNENRSDWHAPLLL